MTNANTDSIDRGLVLGNKVLVAEVFAKNGFLVLSNVTGEENAAEVNADQGMSVSAISCCTASAAWQGNKPPCSRRMA